MRFCCFILLSLIIAAFSPTPADAAPKKPATLCTVHYPSDDLIDWECRKLRWGDTPIGLFGKYWREVLRFNRIDRRHFLAGQSIKVPRHLPDMEGFTPMPAVHADARDEEKFILVDQSESFLGAYEYGRLVFSAPVAVGEKQSRTPNGEFRITAFHRWHKSSLYTIEGIDTPYPMHYGLRFHIDENWVSYWIHGRDLPGYPVSHGCIGLYDEAMQSRYYGNPRQAILDDAETLYRWVVGERRDSGRMRWIGDGPRLLITGEPPR